MDARPARRKCSISALGKALLGVALLGAFPPPLAQSSPIRHRRAELRVRQVRASGGLASFLEGGPELWARSRTPRVPARIALGAVGGAAADTSLQAYLQWKRGLNAAR